jgi:hypothetical protein
MARLWRNMPWSRPLSQDAGRCVYHKSKVFRSSRGDIGLGRCLYWFENCQFGVDNSRERNRSLPPGTGAVIPMARAVRSQRETLWHP